MQRRDLHEKRHQWEQSGDHDVVRRRASRMRRAQKQKIENMTRLHYLTCKKRDKNYMEEGSNSFDDVDVLALAEDILKAEEGIDAGFLRKKEERGRNRNNLLPENSVGQEVDDTIDE